MLFKASSFVTILSLSLGPVSALVEHGFSSPQLALIRSRLLDGAHASWELGTAIQAFLEIDAPQLSVFGPAPFPPPFALNWTSPILTIADQIVSNKPPGIDALMADGAAGDPPSNGIGVLLANWSSPTDDKYLRAVQQQISFLENQVPHGDNGVISHRTEQLQLWADFISMVPPLFAYYGAMQPGTDAEAKYLWEAYNQIKLYREALRDPETNLWHHILWGGWEDRGFWATGQGWAAYGILRVQQTIAKSNLGFEMSQQSEELLEWAGELVAATWKYAQPDGSLKNYLDRDDSFTELSSTTLMAAATYRLAVLTNITEHIPAADKAFELIKTKIDADGWLLDVVDPYGFTNPGQHSPEGQAFTLMLQSAFRDYQNLRDNITGSLSTAFNALLTVASKAQAAAKGVSAPRRRHHH